MFLPKLSVMVVFSFWEVGGGGEREREREREYVLYSRADIHFPFFV